ncbi:iron uptake transporter deferrochelatase/peroxidase subunit [Nocardia sp. NBC_00511]|uniref:iron uptake transporter deferrochelatase/peroxidase subunit n=1 Tax=Nocardia sp. NBC_00511 TaxID=2903591 RepID=UPI0030E56CEF
MTVSRRRFLSGAAVGAAGTALTAGVLVEGAHVDAGATAVSPERTPVFPFHGVHQSGILTPGPADKQSASCFASFDVTVADRGQLVALMKTLTERARTLTSGGAAPDLGLGQPPADSAVLGPEIPADGLTVTTGVGASLFDQRFGLAALKPARLTPMRIFPDDSPDPVWMHGDLLVQLCAHNQDAIHHAIRDITRHTRGALQLRWKIQGYNSPPRPSGTGRNLLGFKDGTANPTGTDATDLVWSDGSGEPAWTKDGTYQVVRLIRMLVEFWDRVSIAEQENMFGRRRESGAPLDGNKEFDVPNYSADPDGTVIKTDSHIRLANPRTSETANQQLIRRSYNYDLGLDTNGNMSAGHIFTCFQQDVQRQFEAIQTRLAGEPLTDYVQPFGGGYFFVLPGVTDANDWYGRALLS